MFLLNFESHGMKYLRLLDKKDSGEKQVQIKFSKGKKWNRIANKMLHSFTLRYTVKYIANLFSGRI